MNRMMITSTNTMDQLQKKIDTISNNMANVSTTGYKRKEAFFQDMLVQEMNNQERADKEKGRLTPNGIRIGVGAKLNQAQVIMDQGSLKSTDRKLDVALLKENQFFKIKAQEGNASALRFTRDGAFYLSPIDGTSNRQRLVTGNGDPVLDESNQEIIMEGSPKELAFNERGELTVTTYDRGTQTFPLGIVSIQKPQFLEMTNNNTFALPQNMAQLGVTEADILTQLSGKGRGEISLKQGVLEQSNVDLSTEMTELMTAQRQYQFQSRAVSMADQMMGLVNGIR